MRPIDSTKASLHTSDKAGPVGFQVSLLSCRIVGIEPASYRNYGERWKLGYSSIMTAVMVKL
jgi:hypothetical protein